MTGTSDESAGGAGGSKPAPGRTSDVVLRLVDDVDHERVASVLRHENSFLRARLEGRGRIEADPQTVEQLKAARSRIAQLDSRVADLTGQRDQLAERTRRLEGEVRSSQLISERLTDLERRLGTQAAALERHEERHLLERDQHTAALTAVIDDLELRLDHAEQARGDLGWLLERLRHTPFAPILRRRPGYRAMEDRWRR